MEITKEKKGVLMRKPIMSEKNFKTIMIAFVGWIVLALISNAIYNFLF